MKNLKKVLSLVLALAMALSLMTVAFAKDASDYADYDKVTYNEAVDVMTAIGVFDGMDGTNFDPAGTLTREQAAKIITYMLMGKENADKLTTTIAPYSDVSASRWSAGAIAYCTNAGILSGVGHGKFNPTDKLTGLQFSKMLLVALGYSADQENLTGESWGINAATLGIAAGLTDGMTGVALNGYLTREQAAQMAFNAEKAVMVEYATKTEVTTGAGTVTISGGRRDVEWSIGGAANDGNIDHDGYVQFAEKYCTDLVAAPDSDAFYNPATTWNFKGTDVGTYVDKAGLTYTSTVNYKALKKALPSAVVSNIHGTVNYYVDGAPATFRDANLIAGNDVDLATTGKGVLTQIYYTYNTATKDYTVTITSTNTYATKVTSSEKNDDGKYDIDTTSVYKFESEASFAEDTIVLYTWSAKENGVQTMKAAQSITGDTTLVKTDTTNQAVSFTMNGTTYEYSMMFDKNDKGDQGKLTQNAKNVVAYVDDYGYVIRIDKADVADNYAVILAYNQAWTAGKTTEVQLLLSDGTVKKVEANTSKSFGGSWNTNLNNDLVTYTVDSDGIYTLKNAGADDAAANGYAYVTKGTSGMKINVAQNAPTVNEYANNKTIFFLYDGDSYKAYVGINNVPSLSGAITNYAIAKDATTGIVKAVYLVSSSNIETGTAGETAAYLMKHAAFDRYYITSDNVTYYTINAVVDGKATTLDVDETTYKTTMGSTDETGTLVKSLSVDSNNRVTSYVTVDTDNQKTGAVTAAKDGVIGIGTAKYTYSSNVVCYVYDLSDKAFSAKSITSLKDGITATAQVNDDGVIVAIYSIQA